MSSVTPSNLRPTNNKNKDVKKSKAKAFVAPNVNNINKESIVAQFNNANPIYQKYLAMLLNPHDNEVIGLPDATSARTVLYRSIRTFPIFADFGVGSSNGRFSAAIQPKIGNVTTPQNYSVALCSFQNDTTDFTSSTSYASYSNGVDPRVDDNINTLVGQETAFWSINTPSVSSVANVFSKAVPSIYNRNIDIDIVSIGGDTSSIRIPPGEYVLSVYIACSGPNTLAVASTGSVSFIALNGTSATNAANIISYSRIYTVTSLSSTLTFTYSNITTVDQVVTITPISVNLSSSLLPQTENYGNCKKIRPIAMSVLASYSGTTLRDGGMISACLIPGDSLIDNFFTNNPISGGQYQMWENLSRVPMAYNGPLREGTYSYWRPDSDLDTYLRTPDESNLYNFPTIIVSGEFSPGETLSGQVQVGRLQVVQVYEWTTTSTMFEAYTRPGSHNIMDAITSSISGYNTSMSNPIHLSDIGKYMKSALAFLWKNRAALGTIATTAATLL